MILLTSMLPIAFVYASPIILAALGGLFSERSGVVNVALEGIMLVGAFVGAAVTVVLEPVTPGAVFFGLVAAVVSGWAFSLLHAYASINLKADQVISGTALNILAGGLTVYLCQIFFNQQRTRAFEHGIAKISIPGLDQIPGLGPILFQQASPPFFLMLILVALAWYVLAQTPFGLRLRACGENPQAAASMGIHVYAMRYWGVGISGALGGLAGAVMVLTQDIQFTASSVHGTGFIALGCLIFGKWNPWGVLGAGLFFGFAQAMSIYANDIPVLQGVPLEFFYLLPYLLTAIALVVFAGKSVGPKAAGEIYDPGKR